MIPTSMPFPEPLMRPINNDDQIKEFIRKDMREAMAVVNIVSFPLRGVDYLIDKGIVSACSSSESATKICQAAGEAIGEKIEHAKQYVPTSIRNFPDKVRQIQQSYGIPENETNYFLESSGLLFSAAATAATGGTLSAVQKVGGKVLKVAQKSASASKKASSELTRYLESAKNFVGAPKEFNGTLSKPLCVVQYHGAGKVGIQRSLKWWTPVTQGNNLCTLDAVMEKLALLPKFGERSHVSVARVPSNEPIRFLHGKASKQIDSVTKEIAKGGGTQYRFLEFKPEWILETREIPSFTRLRPEKTISTQQKSLVFKTAVAGSLLSGLNSESNIQPSLRKDLEAQIRKWRIIREFPLYHCFDGSCYKLPKNIIKEDAFLLSHLAHKEGVTVCTTPHAEAIRLNNGKWGVKIVEIVDGIVIGHHGMDNVCGEIRGLGHTVQEVSYPEHIQRKPSRVSINSRQSNKNRLRERGTVTEITEEAEKSENINENNKQNVTKNESSLSGVRWTGMKIHVPLDNIKKTQLGTGIEFGPNRMFKTGISTTLDKPLKNLQVKVSAQVSESVSVGMSTSLRHPVKDAHVHVESSSGLGASTSLRHPVRDVQVSVPVGPLMVNTNLRHPGKDAQVLVPVAPGVGLHIPLKKPSKAQIILGLPLIPGASVSIPVRKVVKPVEKLVKGIIGRKKRHKGHEVDEHQQRINQLIQQCIGLQQDSNQCIDVMNHQLTNKNGEMLQGFADTSHKVKEGFWKPMVALTQVEENVNQLHETDKRMDALVGMQQFRPQRHSQAVHSEELNELSVTSETTLSSLLQGLEVENCIESKKCDKTPEILSVVEEIDVSLNNIKRNQNSLLEEFNKMSQYMEALSRK